MLSARNAAAACFKLADLDTGKATGACASENIMAAPDGSQAGEVSDLCF